MYRQGDTIVALSTPPGRGAIAVVRLSGPDSLRVISSCTDGTTGKFTHGCQKLLRLVEPKTGTELDRAVAVFRRAPSSYTGEDMAELSVHGGRAVTARALAALVEAGARPASPGEFTLRAFLNGKMDLAQAEAVAGMIAAESSAQAACALRALSGGLSAEIVRLYETLVGAGAEAEASVEFPEDVPEPAGPALAAAVERSAGAISRLRATYAGGRMIEEGARVVIAGRPNAGKSSLFNALSGAERAIVTDIPGTTRDFLEYAVEWDGIAVRLFDTAGLGGGGDPVERIGRERARDLVEAADAVILVADRTLPPHAEDRELASRLAGRCVVAVNKSDLEGPALSGPSDFKAPAVEISALEPSGLEALEAEVMKILAPAADCLGEPVVITNARHYALLAEAGTALERVALELGRGATVDLVLGELNCALEALGRITGRTPSEDLLQSIFSRFCVGK